jgi:hypothetical protein
MWCKKIYETGTLGYYNIFNSNIRNKLQIENNTNNANNENINKARKIIRQVILSKLFSIN